MRTDMINKALLKEIKGHESYFCLKKIKLPDEI